MVEHKIVIKRRRRITRPRLQAALLAVVLAGVGALGLSYFGAARAAAVTTLELNAWPLQDQASGAEAGAVVADYEGTFDPRTKQMVLQTARTERTADGRTRNVRVDPNSEVPRNTGFTFTVVNSTFIQSGDLAGKISGEIQLMNKAAVTLYNTRLLFTRFKVCPTDTNAPCNGTVTLPNANATPGQTGFSYFNDGFIPYQGSLNISRAYGNIASGATSNAVWSFDVSTTPARFFFSFVVLADVGVAAESVYPAAVQVNANNGAGIVIRGQNFTGAPTVNLLNNAGASVATLSNVVVVNATQITATVPPGTAPGVYGVRVTLAGGTPGGTGSSSLSRRLIVTGVPDGGHTLSGNVTSLPDTGPFLLSSDVTFTSNVTVQPGTVFYAANNTRVLLSAAGNLTANGGIPGVAIPSVATATPIVFTAQRSPGAALPVQGAWGGIDATAASSSTLTLRNVVVEFGGANAKPNLDITGSGRTLRFTDSITRHSAGAGLAAGGSGDVLTGFTRNRVEYNGVAAGTAALIVSANAALGLFEIPATTGQDAAPLGTFVTDASYFYGAANVFTGTDSVAAVIQIPAATNDFTRSGVLVGQGDTPIQIRGSNTNPSIVGAVPPAPPAELTIGPGAVIQLDAGMDLQAGDYGLNRVGGLAANGFAGVNQVPGAGQGAARYITFDKLTGGGNFGALFFARNATSSSLLFFVRVLNGGSSDQGKGAVISDGSNLSVRNSQINNSSTGGVVELSGSLLNTGGTTGSGNANLLIDTVAGGLYGDGNVGVKTTLVSPVLAAADPQGRGIYFVDQVTNRTPLLRFLNTTRNAVTLAGIKIAGGTVRAVAGGGVDLLDNTLALTADLGKVTGLAVSPGTGDVVYFIDQGGSQIRFVNVSTSSIVINGQTTGAGRVGTFSIDSQFGPTLNGLAVKPNGDVLVADATTGQHRVYRIPATGGNASVFASTGVNTKAIEPFVAGPATGIPLLTPRAVATDPAGNTFIADTGHGRVIKVDGAGLASLVAQFTADRNSPIGAYARPPFPSGLAVLNNKVYIALGSAHQLVVVEGQSAPKVVGNIEVFCDYSSNSCGDGGPAANGLLNLVSSSADIPLASITADAKGIYICDQVLVARGRLRFVNLSGSQAEIAGLIVPANVINTVAGTGGSTPYDGGLATSAELKSPGGIAVDPTNGSLWIADTLNSKLRYVNRTNAPITLFGSLSQTEQLTVPPGTIVTVNRDVGKIEGGGTDDVPAIQAGFDTPSGLLVTAQGVFVVDTKRGPSLPGTLAAPINRRTSVIRFINTTNQPVVFFAGTSNEISVPAGYIKVVFGGGVDTNKDVNDGPDVRNAKFVGASDIAISPITGDFYIADCGNSRVRRIRRASGAVSTLSELPGATILALTQPPSNMYTGLAFDATGRLLVVDTLTHRLLRRQNPDANSDTASTTNNFVTLLSGNLLNRPRDLVVDANGVVYLTNTGDSKILRLTISGNTASPAAIAGTGGPGYAGDFGPANLAQMNLDASQILVSTFGTKAPVEQFVGIALGLNGEIYFCDPKNDAVRRLR
ncbi:MAG: hypothetical protein HYR56_23530 [Acidobacteria bacterium]|nr:hypothetical protein [Acidobacteriota bacterium]MBI3426266.1 hypothetical protein [Acidobacteriota bacterium]